MNPRSVICKRQEDSISGGMLLSPTDALTTMTLVPLAAFVLVLLAMSGPLQNSFGSNRTLDFSLFPDGSAHIFYELESDPLFPDTIVTLFGSSIENLVVEDENGFLLSAETYQNNPNIFEIVFTRSVFANPGTPINRACPPIKIVLNICLTA